MSGLIACKAAKSTVTVVCMKILYLLALLHSFFYLRISNQKGSSISKLIYCRPHVPIYLNLSNPITLHLYAVSNEHIFLQRLHYFSNTRLFLLLNKLYTLGVTFISFVFSFGHTISCSFGRNCFIIFSILDSST